MGVNEGAETAPARDAFDDILDRIEALRQSTDARIAALSTSTEIPPEPVASLLVAEAAAIVAELSRPTTLQREPEERVDEFDGDLDDPADVQPAAHAPMADSPVGGPTAGRITLPTLRIPRPVMAVAGGMAVLFVVAALAPGPVDPDADETPATPTVSESPPGLSTALPPVMPPPAPEPEPEPEPVVRSAPLAVRIPAIAVDATTVPVGLEGDGSMEIPSDVSTIGWYEPAEGLGVVPGQTGTAVLAGHVDSRTQGTGAFYFLRELTVGDSVEIAHEDGSVSTWRITEVVQYAKDSLPIDEVFVWSGAPRLALITCGGPFDWTARSYTDNLVVFAELVAPSA